MKNIIKNHKLSLLFLVMLKSNLLWAQCSWSSISAVQINKGFTSIKSDGTLWVIDENAASTQIGVDNDWRLVSSGYLHCLAIKNNGTLWAWGDNSYGQLGDGTIISKNNPIQIGVDNDWKTVSTNANTSYAIKNSGTLWAWGDNTDYLYGNGTSISETQPIQIGTDNWLTISRSNLIKSDGTLWGIINQIDTSTNWVFAEGGVGLKNDSTLWTWGNNSNGQLGNGTYIDNPIPTQPEIGSKWASVSGSDFRMAIKNDGTLWAWGSHQLTLTQLSLDNDWIFVTVGGSHGYAIKADGSVWEMNGGWYLVSGGLPILFTSSLSTSSNLTETACDSYTLNGTTYTSSGIYNQTLTNTAGCDSIITLDLTIFSSTNNATNATACDSYIWSVNGSTYTNSGTYTHVTACNTETLNLTITSGTSNTTTTSACGSYLWSENGATYTSSGNYTHTVGCHTETLNLTITPEVLPSVIISANPGTNVMPGACVTFTAVPNNGGSPNYQWYWNGNPVGTNDANYTNSNISDGDEIYCEMTSSLGCVSTTTVSSNLLSINILPSGPSWASNEGNAGTADYGNAITKDCDLNYYVGGIKGNLGFITKYSSSGTVIWTRNYGSNVSGIVINNAGNAVVTGGFTTTTTFGGLTSSGSFDAYVAKLDANGDISSAVKIGGTSIDQGNAITQDEYANIYIAGDFNGTVDFDPSLNVVTRTSHGYRDIFVLKLDANLGFQWVYTEGGTSHDKALGIASGDAIYVAGQYFGAMSGMTSAGNYDGFVMKLSKNSGSVIWERSFGSVGGEDKGNAIALDASNNVYIAGTFSGTILGVTASGSSADALIFSLDNGGNLRWAKKGGAGGKDIAYGISVNGNDVLSTGVVRSATGTFSGAPNGINGTVLTNDLFIVKYLTDGSFGCLRLMSGFGDQEGRAIWAGPGTFAITGINSNTFGAELDDVTNIPLTTTGSFDAFIIKGKTCSAGAMKMAHEPINEQSSISVYPNPNHGQFNVMVNGKAKLIVYNMNGSILVNQEIENYQEIDLKEAVSGIYLVRIQTETVDKSFKIHVVN